LYGTVAYKSGSYDLSIMTSNYGFINDDCSSMLAFNNDDGTSWDIYLYTQDNFSGTELQTRSDSTFDTATADGLYLQYGYWIGSGWTKIYCGVPALKSNDNISSMRILTINSPSPEPVPPVETGSVQSNLSTEGGNSKFYTRINGKDYNIDSLVRTGAANASKGRYSNQSGYNFAGVENGSSGIENSTLATYNFRHGGYGIDYMDYTSFMHDNGSGRFDLGNYFGAPYEEATGYTSWTTTAPSWCNRVVGICVGGGGGGGAGRFGDNDGQGGGGGGSGAAIAGFIDCNGGDSIQVVAGGAGTSNSWEGANGKSGGTSSITIGSKQLIATGGGHGKAGNPGGIGGYTETHSASAILYQNGYNGSSGQNADDDDDEMDSDRQHYQAPGAASVYNWTSSGNGQGNGGYGGSFGNDDEFDGDYGGNGSAGFVRIYFIRKPK
jgi:hypothetical protein